MPDAATVARTPKPEPDWDLVLKRNPVERIKRDKNPLGIRDELPALIAAGYEAVAEEDIVRLQWWGLYHDKPKIGRFMLRIKLPSGQVSPAQLRAIGEVSQQFGRGDAELATRQNIQLHWLELSSLPDVFAALDAAGLSTAGGCGDTVRNITGCPVQGLAHDELFDASAVVEEAAAFFYGNPDYTDLPRKHKITISACAHACNAPEINCIALVGAIVDGREGFSVRVGGGLSSVPRISRDMGVFVPREQAVTVLAAILDAWKTDLRYRVSRVKARLKFMVDDIGPEGMRERVEALLGYRLEDYEPEELPRPVDHLGVHPQKQAGHSYVGVPVHLGLISADQLVAVAGPGGGDRCGHPHHAPPELHRRRHPRRTARRHARAPGGDRLPAEPERPSGARGRLHGRAALQLLGHGDEEPARAPRRAPGGTLRRGGRRARPSAGRVPALLCAALDRGHRLPGHDRARRRRQATAGLRHLRARRPRPRGADRDAALPRVSRRRSSTRPSTGSLAAGSKDGPRAKASRRSRSD